MLAHRSRNKYVFEGEEGEDMHPNSSARKPKGSRTSSLFICFVWQFLEFIAGAYNKMELLPPELLVGITLHYLEANTMQDAIFIYEDLPTIARLITVCKAWYLSQTLLTQAKTALLGGEGNRA